MPDARQWVELSDDDHHHDHHDDHHNRSDLRERRPPLWGRMRGFVQRNVCRQRLVDFLLVRPLRVVPTRVLRRGGGPVRLL